MNESEKRFSYTRAASITSGRESQILISFILLVALSGFGQPTNASVNVRAWGDNGYGQTNVPPDLTNAVAISTGEFHSLALKADGTVAGWGQNFYGEATGVPNSVGGVVTVAGQTLSNVVAIAAGGYHSLALKADGTVVGWGTGTNDGLVPNSGQALIPASATNVVAIAAGYLHSLALRTNGTVVGWGDDSYGQCDVPMDLPFVEAISGEGNFSVALINPTMPGSPPIVLQYPITQTAVVGSTAYFSVEAYGFPPLSYQWYFGTNAIAGATNTVLVLSGLQGSQSGQYTVVVSNSAGATTSQPSRLNVLPALDIRMVPAISLIGDVGSSYFLEYVNAIGPTNGWVTLARVTVTNIGELYFDVSASGQPARFYRLVQVP